MADRVIAIGDIHGCAAALRVLVEAMDVGPRDTLVCLGDVIDRGPDSRGAMEQLLQLRDRCRLIPLLGNHEEMMLAYVDGRPLPDDWLYFGGKETLHSYGALENVHAVPQEHLDYMRTWGDYWETASHFFVHGNYDPEVALSQQPYRVYRWVSLRESVPGPHLSGKTAVLGHTSQKNGEILDLGYLKCIDTYCHGGGWLTAMDVTTGQVWQADCKGRVRNRSS